MPKNSWQWLVSVRSMKEFQLASRAGVDVLDWKEPASGALAPVEPRLWQQAAADATVQRRSPATAALSAALGEPGEAEHIASRVPDAFAFAKAGPSGLGHEADLRNFRTILRQRLPPSVELVAVAYADHQQARCLAAETVFELARQCGLNRVLVDTFSKSQTSLQRLGPVRMRELARRAHQLSLWWALAGSITVDSIAVLDEWLADRDGEIIKRPDCFAVRGDVCDGDRTATLSMHRLQRWTRLRSV